MLRGRIDTLTRNARSGLLLVLLSLALFLKLGLAQYRERRWELEAAVSSASSCGRACGRPWRAWHSA